MTNPNYPDRPWIEPCPNLASALIVAYDCVGGYLGGNFRSYDEARESGARFVWTTSGAWLDLFRPIDHFPGFVIVDPVTEPDREKRLCQTL